ncbi:hypothetical protein VTP01DRAFT_2250 [Rhizomucor pusillus]|uniref:uncharacterized protein n=1 Tax=Rhizomucor pusillus TaxID=4840 RepID=UPI0037426C53
MFKTPKMVDDFYDSINVCIRWQHNPDLVFAVSPSSDTIDSVKSKIRQSVPSVTENKNIRLIYQGRVLDNDKTLSAYGVGRLLEGQDTAPTVYIHCALSDYVSSNNSNEYVKPTRLTPFRGFDRLREAGFNEEEIRDIRMHFHQSRMNSYDGETTEQTLAIEEQWMESSGDMLPEGVIQGTYQEMVCGLLLGFFLGILCIFWFRESVFTRRHQMGIVAGVLINISFSVMHVYQ